MSESIIARLLPAPERSFFLFGPRGVGKSTWLRSALPSAAHLDLLDASLLLDLTRDHHLLEAIVGDRPARSFVVLDEVQKLPGILDEVQRLIEKRRWRFALCGSSARKLRRAEANLLAGRAVTRRLSPFCSAELGPEFDLGTALEWGLLPLVWADRGAAADILSAYVLTYLTEEVRAEGLVRHQPPFVRFLSIAGMLNGQVLNRSTISREAAVPRSTVDSYFTILCDTLLGEFLPAYQPRAKVRETAHPKFYWFDPGVARGAAGRLHDPLDDLSRGAAFENLLLHELRVHNEVAAKHRPISYYRTASGSEVDFVVELAPRRGASPPRIVCIEAKAAKRWDRKWEEPIRDLASRPAVRVERMFGVYLGPRALQFDDYTVLPALDFFRRLHAGDVF